MAKKEKKKLNSNSPADTFVPDLSLAPKEETSTGLLDAMKGSDEAVIDSPADVISLGFNDSDLSVGQPKKTRKPYTKRTKVVNEEGEFLDGEEIQMFVDIIVPMAIAGIHNLVNKEKMSPDSLMLTGKQEEKMNRLCQRVADRLKMNMNPFIALGIMGSAMYAGNYIKNKP